MHQTNAQKVISKVEQLVVDAKKIHGLSIEMPLIVFNIRQNSRLIGECVYGRTCRLRFNLTYMNMNIDEYMQTVIHEFSHYIAFLIYGSDQRHNANFAHVVRSFGGHHVGATTRVFSTPSNQTSTPLNQTSSPIIPAQITNSNDEVILSQIKALLNTLSLTALQELNVSVVDLVKQKRLIVGNQITRKLNVGDIVEFTHTKTREIIKIKINKFSRDGAKVTGCTIGGYNSWVVPATMLRSVN